MVVSGFVSGGRSWGGGVVLRVSRSGWVWSLRAARAGGWSAPAALCVPFLSRPGSVAWAVSVARVLGWRVWVRRGRRCSAAWEVKLALPSGLSARSARAVLPQVGV